MSKVVSGMLWFKHTFGAQTAQAVQGTPFSVDLLTAIAVQETFYIWGSLIGVIPDAQILEVCVGDTLDKPNRGAFPVDQADLLGDSGQGPVDGLAEELVGVRVDRDDPPAVLLHVGGHRVRRLVRGPARPDHGDGVVAGQDVFDDGVGAGHLVTITAG